MTLYKQYPISDGSRESSLTNAILRRDSGEPSANVFTAKNNQLLDLHTPLFIQCKKETRKALTFFRKINSNYSELVEQIKNISSHGLQIVNFKIIDKCEGWSRDLRVLYGMDLNGHLPASGTEWQIVEMAQHFISGETARVAQGGAPLADVTKEEVKALIDALTIKRINKQDAAEALRKTQATLKKERHAVDKLIISMWNDIEHVSQDMRKGSQYSFEKSWGMIFANVPDPATVNIRTEDEETKEIIVGVKLRIGPPDGKGGTKGCSNDFGTATLKSKNFKPTHIIAEHIQYEKAVREITLEEDETITVLMKMKKRTLIILTNEPSA